MFGKQSKTYRKTLSINILAFLLFLLPIASQAAPSGGGEKEEGATDFILHHVVDDYVWHFFDGDYGTIYLPVILYSGDRGLEVFSSHHFYDDHHELVAYNGYEIHDGHIAAVDHDRSITDLSITKNTAMLFVTMAVVLLLVLIVLLYLEKTRLDFSFLI